MVTSCSLRRCRCIAHIHTQGPYNGSASELTTLSSLNKSYFPRSTAVMHTALYGASMVASHPHVPGQNVAHTVLQAIVTFCSGSACACHTKVRTLTACCCCRWLLGVW